MKRYYDEPEPAEEQPITVRIRGRYLPHLLSSGIMSILGFSYMQLDGPGYRKRLEDATTRIQATESASTQLQAQVKDLRGNTPQVQDLRVAVARLEAKLDAISASVEELRIYEQQHGHR